MPDQEAYELRYVGDKMQSGASRLLEWAQKQTAGMPYEVQMACFELDTSINQWTDARIDYATQIELGEREQL